MRPQRSATAASGAPYNAGVKPLIPVFFLAGLTLWAGTLWGQATAAGAFTGALAALVILLLLVWQGGGGLGRERPAVTLLALLALLALASYLLSPVRDGGAPRAALWLGLAALPWLIAALWREAAARRPALAGLDLLVLSAALWALVSLGLTGSARTTMPLGHHNLLAVWLVVMLPFSAVAAIEEGGRRRVLALAALFAGLAALFATRSLSGLLALAVEAALAFAFFPRLRWALTAGAGLALAAMAPRLLALASGGDPSVAARRVYWEAGWRGILERPWLGWGPGSVPLTIGLHLEPVPGLNPPSEVVGELHNLPLELAYELGLPALALILVLAGFLVLRSRRGLSRFRQPALARAALLALAGAAVTALSVAWTAVPALTAAVALAAGAGLAAGANPPLPWATAPRRTPVLVTAVLVVPFIALTVQQLRAGLAYEAARRAPSRVRMCAELARAWELLPRDPLLAARAAWCEDGRVGSALARGAAERAPGIAMLWLASGVHTSAGEPQHSRLSLEHALALAPLAGEAPLYLALLEPDDALAAPCLARALLAEPRLAAAIDLVQRPELLRRARDEILAWEGIEPGWRVAMAEILERGADPGAKAAPFGIGRESALGGLSLWAFRRRPWPAEWFSIPVDAARFEEIRIPPASTLPGSARAAFPKQRCARSPL